MKRLLLLLMATGLCFPGYGRCIEDATIVGDKKLSGGEFTMEVKVVYSNMTIDQVIEYLQQSTISENIKSIDIKVKKDRDVEENNINGSILDITGDSTDIVSPEDHNIQDYRFTVDPMPRTGSFNNRAFDSVN